MTPSVAAGILRFNTATLIIAFGVIWALGAVPGWDGPVRFFLDILKWPIDGDPGVFDATDRWFSALGGAFLAAFGVIFYLLVIPGVERGDPEARKAGVAALLVWFVIDSSGSIAAGAASNAAFNVVILAAFLAPLLLVRPARAGAFS